MGQINDKFNFSIWPIDVKFPLINFCTRKNWLDLQLFLFLSEPYSCRRPGRTSSSNFVFQPPLPRHPSSRRFYPTAAKQLGSWHYDCVFSPVTPLSLSYVHTSLLLKKNSLNPLFLLLLWEHSMRLADSRSSMASFKGGEVSLKAHGSALTR